MAQIPLHHYTSYIFYFVLLIIISIYEFSTKLYNYLHHQYLLRINPLNSMLHLLCETNALYQVHIMNSSSHKDI